jgi:serine phosphatase RsbU (regulator of sigma subunit)
MLGDVCGRGAIAATTTALVRHTARAVAPLLPGPDAVVQAVNKALLDRPDSHGTGFVTMVYGHLAPAAGGGLDITLVRAGHPPPLHIDHRRAVRSVDIVGSFLGVTAEPQLPACRLRLGPAESLLLYTDGITEARNSEHEQFGEERLARILSQDPGEVPSAQQVIDVVTAAVRAFDGSTGTGTGTGDDQAILVLTGRRKQPSPSDATDATAVRLAGRVASRGNRDGQAGLPGLTQQTAEDVIADFPRAVLED